MNGALRAAGRKLRGLSLGGREGLALLSWMEKPKTGVEYPGIQREGAEGAQTWQRSGKKT